MSNSQESLRHKIDGAEELGAVVRTMKALASSNIGQYEKAVNALSAYYRTVELGLGACLRLNGRLHLPINTARQVTPKEVIVFGSDQGLVGQFNESLADFLSKELTGIPGEKEIVVVGDRMRNHLADAMIPIEQFFSVPTSVSSIAPLVSDILFSSKALNNQGKYELYVSHNSPNPNGTYTPIFKRVLPLDNSWLQEMTSLPWPKPFMPQIINPAETLKSLIGEYVFVSLFKACAESLNSENAARVIAMQRAEKNIRELLEDVRHSFNLIRQNAIDEELFDVLSGFEAMSKG